jgi:hypothetical protein
MKRNMGKTDRIIRGIVGIILVILGIMYMGIWYWNILFAIGVILLITAVIGWCPIYTLCKKSTLK